MRIAVFGGAFDPIHNGHCKIVDYLIEDPQFDRIAIVPTGTPVFHKDFMFSAPQRVNMLLKLYQDQPSVDIFDYEIQKETPSYMIETLRYIQQAVDQAVLTLVIGYDQFMQFHRWQYFEEILSNYQLLVMNRKGVGDATINNILPSELKLFEKSIQFSECDLPEVSSSLIRQMIQNGDVIEPLVPEVVLSEIS